MGHATLFTANLICIGMLLIALAFVIWAYKESWTIEHIIILGIAALLALVIEGMWGMQHNIDSLERQYAPRVEIFLGKYYGQWGKTLATFQIKVKDVDAQEKGWQWREVYLDPPITFQKGVNYYLFTRVKK